MKKLVDLEPGEQIGGDAAAAVQFLHRVEPVIEKLRDRGIFILLYGPECGGNQSENAKACSFGSSCVSRSRQVDCLAMTNAA